MKMFGYFTAAFGILYAIAATVYVLPYIKTFAQAAFLLSVYMLCALLVGFGLQKRHK